MSLRRSLLTFFVAIALFCAGFLGFLSARPGVAHAQLGIPFGGPILATWWCTCSGGIALTIGPPVGGNYVFQFGTSIPFAFGQVFRPGPWTLGTQIPGGVCLYFVGIGCAPYPAIGTIAMVGTSL
jgi:hypothetical protein